MDVYGCTQCEATETRLSKPSACAYINNLSIFLLGCEIAAFTMPATIFLMSFAIEFWVYTVGVWLVRKMTPFRLVGRHTRQFPYTNSPNIIDR